MDAPMLSGIHHVKLPVRDLARSRPWYETTFGLTPLIEFRDEPDGPVRGVAFTRCGDVQIALRENPDTAAALCGYDPVAFGIADRDAALTWIDHLDALGIDHSPVIDAAIGWLIVFNDPDGLELRLYTMAEHHRDASPPEAPPAFEPAPPRSDRT